MTALNLYLSGQYFPESHLNKDLVEEISNDDD